VLGVLGALGVTRVRARELVAYGSYAHTRGKAPNRPIRPSFDFKEKSRPIRWALRPTPIR